jgi:tetratricopeptide (TPR) repeat protein
MRSKLQLMFIFMCLAALGAYGQGIGDRNRPAGRGNYRITGKVYLPDGSPAKDVGVSVSGAETTGSSTRTDVDGLFTLSGLSSGNYSVSIREKGYQTENEFLTIPEGAASGQSFQLVFYMRTPGQPKRPAAAANPLLKDVPKDALAKYEKGMDKVSKKDFKGATADFDAAIAIYPNFAAAYYEKGSALIRNNDADKATEAFVKAISIKSDYTEAKYGYALAQFEKKNYEVAAAAFNDVLQEKKDMAEAHLNLGISLFYLKNVNAAESELKSAISSKGGDKMALAHLYLGQIYAQKKKNADAVTELEKYLELLPKAPNAERIRSAIADLKKQT